MEPIIVPVHANIPGRARLKIRGLRACERQKTHLAHALHQEKLFTLISISFTTENILIGYQPDHAIDTIINRIYKVIKRFFSGDQKQADDQYRGSARAAAVPGNDSLGRLNELPRHSSLNNPLPISRFWHQQSVAKIISLLQTHPQSGLSYQDVLSRLAEFGPNTIPSPTQRSKLSILLNQFQSLPVTLLGIAALLSLVTGAAVDAAVIIGVLGINSFIGYLTESQAEQTIRSMQNHTLPPVRVIRDSQRQKTAPENIVQGDIIDLRPGTYVAADARIIETDYLTIDESSLTGESVPAIKTSKALSRKNLALSDLKNIAFKGTIVTGGQGKAVVIGTGIHTALGHFQAMLQNARSPKPPIEKKLSETGNQLVLILGGVCLAVFATGLIRGYTLLNMIRVAVTLAASAIPEGLPAAATSTFALGIRKMRKHGILIRYLPAVETLGSVQTICFDKTGTITQNRMQVEELFMGMRRIELNHHRLSSEFAIGFTEYQNEFKQLLTIGSLCSEVKINGNNCQAAPELVGSSTENALIKLALAHGMDVKAIRKTHPLLKVIYRSEKRQMMSTLHSMPDGMILHAVKGNPVEVLNLCSHQVIKGKITPLSEMERDIIIGENNRMAAKSLRVLGAAARIIPDLKYAFQKKSSLAWVGLIGMSDPVREGVHNLIDTFHRAGIETVMITGDQALTAEAVARKLNLSNGKPLKILDATDIARMSPEQMREASLKVHAYSRLSPGHKLNIVQALQSGGRIVAMTGDGINDGPALKAADLGIAMGEEGTDIAKDVADVVLEKDHLETMIQSLKHGRTTFKNIRKSVHFFLSTNFTEVMLMAASIASGAGAPLNTMQLLWINIISDIFPGLSLALEPPDPDILNQPPRDPNAPLFSTRDYLRMTRESAVISSHAMAAYLIGLSRYGSGIQASSLAFHTLTLAQLLHAYSCRSERESIFAMRHRPQNHWLNAAVFGSIGLHLLTMFVPGIRRFLNLSPLSALDCALIFGSAILSLMVNESLKTTEPSAIKIPAPSV
jgi:Ca2+-transporting ATPase